jgi:hypothetical protein
MNTHKGAQSVPEDQMAERQGCLPTVLLSAISWASVRWWVDRGDAGCAVLNGRFVWNPCGIRGFCRGLWKDSCPCPTAARTPMSRERRWCWLEGRSSVTRLPDRCRQSRSDCLAFHCIGFEMRSACLKPNESTRGHENHEDKAWEKEHKILPEIPGRGPQSDSLEFNELDHGKDHDHSTHRCDSSEIP